MYSICVTHFYNLLQFFFPSVNQVRKGVITDVGEILDKLSVSNMTTFFFKFKYETVGASAGEYKVTLRILISRLSL